MPNTNLTGNALIQSLIQNLGSRLNTVYGSRILELEADNQDLKNNQLTDTANGTNIDLSDSADMRVQNIEVSGNTVQDGEPTPEEPVEIQNCSGSINVVGCNKNLFDGYLTSGYYDSSSKSIAQNSSSSTVFKSFKIYLKKGKYILSCNTKINILRAFTDYNNSSAVIFSSQSTNINSYIMNIQEDTILYISVRRNDNTDWLETDLLQLEKGETVTEYTPHKEQKITFPLQEGQKLMQEDFLADDGIHHVRGQDIFDGSDDENWTLSNSGDTSILRFNRIMPNAKSPQNINLLCNCFIGNGSLYGANKEGIAIVTSQNTAILSVYKDNVENLAAFKTWLQENQITVEYELATPTIEAYTPAQQTAYNQLKKLRTYKGITHIYTDDNIQANLNVTYNKDLEIAFNNLQALVLASGEGE